jgi:putative transposase
LEDAEQVWGMEIGEVQKKRALEEDNAMGIRKFRTFNVMDDCSREGTVIEIDASLSSMRIIRTLERIMAHRGKRKTIRTDNGPEFTSMDVELCCKEQGIIHQYIQ